MFEPSSGTVPAQGQLALAVTFAPTSAAPTNFNVMCTIKKKPTQLSLNVKGEGYAVHDSLQIQGADGLVDLSSDSPNYLDFGQVGCHDTLTQFLVLCTRCSCVYLVVMMAQCVFKAFKLDRLACWQAVYLHTKCPVMSKIQPVSYCSWNRHICCGCRFW